MAKTQIKNYVFKPGISGLGKLYPNAYDLVEANKDFIIAETIEYINQEIDDATKCQRDIGYIIDGAAFDVALGTNYNSVFLGLAEYNSLEVSQGVIRTIQRAKDFVLNSTLNDFSDDATIVSRTTSYFDEILDIISNGRSAADPLTFSIPAGVDTNNYNAALRLISNISFLAAEVNAWVNVTYPSHDHDVSKCERDVRYAVNALIYDVLYGGNSATYDQAKFFFYGFADGSSGITSAHRAQTVAAYGRLKTIVQDVVLGNNVTPSTGNSVSQDTTGTNSNSTVATRLAGLVQITADVVNQTTQAGALSYLAGITRTIPSITWASSSLQLAADYINNDKTAIIEAITWDPDYTYNEEKCIRDMGFVVDAYLHDFRYGGNEHLRKVIKYYWDGDVAQVDGNRIPEIDAHWFIGDLISEYILTNTAWNASNNEYEQYIDSELTAENDSYTPTNVIYKPATGEMKLTIPGHTLTVGSSIIIEEEGLTFTCALDGNSTEHSYPRSSGVPNTTGRDPFYRTALKVSAVSGNIVTVNVGISSDTSTHTFVSAVSGCIKSSAYSDIDALVYATTSVITNGLDYLPTLVPTGIGTIKIQGKYATDELLLITNTSKNEIIYNFSNIATGGTVEYFTSIVNEDEDFKKFVQTTDAVTTIYLNYDTRTMSSSDEIQIFIERTENGKSIVTTRPYDFGTDAIERQRIAPPLSMLDADFEYGLQPTKWAAISTLRGYPSVYEVPGTDTEVFSVTTDASSGTGGVGQSRITITTTAPHGFSAGDPITVKALENSINGFNRAEGSFIISTVPSSTTLTYYAKSKVGTTDGEVLSTGYTQLRKAGFYTGSTIGTPSFDVISQGSFGSMETQLAVLSGSTIIPFDGQSPSLAAPLTASGINVGTQVSSIIDQSAGGGTYITPLTVGNVSAGENQVTVDDVTGIVPNLAVDRGDGYAIYINSIAGNTLTFTGNFTENIKANRETYTDVVGNNQSSIGDLAKFNISIADDSSFTYVLDAIADGGENYEVGDRILIAGEDVGGVSPDNDALIIVTEVGSGNAITDATISGTAVNTDVYLLFQEGLFNGGAGVDAKFDVEFNDNVYTAVDVAVGFAGTGYKVGDVVIIDGASFSSDATGTANDLYISVDTVSVLGAITSVTFDGTAPNVNKDFTSVSYTSTTSSGTGAVIDVNISAGAYDVTFTNEGQNYLPTETITIVGTALGGATPGNDLTITIDNVGGTGNITEFSLSGTPYNGDARTDMVGDNRTPTGAKFNISHNTDGSFVVDLQNPGSGYNAGMELVFAGTLWGGTSPTNDLTVTISGVTDLAGGAISGFTTSGTGYVPVGTYNDVTGVNDPNTGVGATFDITRSNGMYSSVGVNTAGSGYEIGNRILIPGGQLDGISPLNDLLLRVFSVNGSGGILVATPEYDSAYEGDVFDLIATVGLTEPTIANIPVATEITYGAVPTLEISFPNAHGLVPGDTFIVTVQSDDGSNNHDHASGSYFATEIPSVNSLRYQARSEGAIDVTSTSISGQVYPRPDSFFIHRPFDGGVQLGTGGPQHGAQAIRQSKKYIRYQSGKGIMYTTGALFAPSYDLRSVTADGVEVGSLITVTCDDNDHGLQIGGIVRLLGIETPGYNSGPETRTPPQFDYEVVEVVDERVFKVRAQRRLGSTTAVLGFGAQMSVVSWHGATVRSGIFDDQNGIFWEYDGTNISVNQRTGTKQLAGTIEMSVDDNLITGTNTRFRDQLKAGDRIVIKGMTHVVSHVNSQTEITVTPDWRGVTGISGTKINLIVDKKVKQSEFNLDRLDGTGPSGYEIDIAKMQMIGIQFSWYGAGFIDFMLRGSDGNFVFAHRMRNSNINTEAFMRSGNLPVRYEVTNEGPSGKLASAMTDSQNYIELEDSSFFPTSGTVYIDNEIIDFTGKDDSTNRLIGCTRAATFENFQAGSNRQYTAGDAAEHDARTGVILISQTITPLISHWGSAFLTDGGFDEDRGYIFSYAATGVNVTTTKQTAFMIRLAPSVSNAIVGDLGERELLNRAQLLLQGLEITSDSGTGGIVVQGVLNPKNYPLDPGSVTWSTLSTEAQGGQPSFAQIAAGGGIVWSAGGSSSTATLTTLADIDTGWVYEPYNGAAENNSPIEITSANYLANGPILPGSLIYGGDGAGPASDIVYTGGSQGDYYVERVQSRSGFFDVYFRSTTGRTNRASSWPTPQLIKFVYQTYTGKTNRLLFAKAAFDSSGVTTGTPVDTTDTNWPAGTAISSISLKQHGSVQFYEVVFNQTSLNSISAGGTVKFLTGYEPPYAQPGETVFSFIAVPGERSTLDLAQLKELTNTPLGGRGTFPNGPDILAVNIYKVSGAAIDANVILKWGEAQA